MLPMGLRVQEKVERLIDKHMQSIRKYIRFPFWNYIDYKQMHRRSHYHHCLLKNSGRGPVD